MNTVPLAAALVAALSILSLALIRRSGASERDGESAAGLRRARDLAAAILSYAATGSIAIVVTLGTLAVLPVQVTVAARQLAPTAKAIAVGGSLAIALFILQVALGEASHLFQWATWRRVERVNARVALTEMAGQLLGLGAVFIGMLLVATMVSHRFGLLVACVAISLYPLYGFVVQPWFIVLTAPRSVSTAEATERPYQVWADRLAAAAGTRAPRVVILPGTICNAFAMGLGPSRRIVLGAGLTERMDDQQVQAVIAHEIAHIARHDIAKLLIVAMASTVAFMLLHSLAARFLTPGSTGSVLAAAFLGATVLIGIPGWFSRRIEFRADALGARLLEDREALCSALFRLTALKGYLPTMSTTSHPSTSARVAAIRGLAS